MASVAVVVMVSQWAIWKWCAGGGSMAATMAGVAAGAVVAAMAGNADAVVRLEVVMRYNPSLSSKQYPNMRAVASASVVAVAVGDFACLGVVDIAVWSAVAAMWSH